MPRMRNANHSDAFWHGRVQVLAYSSHFLAIFLDFIDDLDIFMTESCIQSVLVFLQASQAIGQDLQLPQGQREVRRYEW